MLPASRLRLSERTRSTRPSSGVRDARFAMVTELSPEFPARHAQIVRCGTQELADWLDRSRNQKQECTRHEYAMPLHPAARPRRVVGNPRHLRGTRIAAAEDWIVKARRRLSLGLRQALGRARRVGADQVEWTRFCGHCP